MNRYSILILVFALAFVSCQQISIGDNEVGVHFKKFGGGVDTTSFFDTGKHSVSSWDRVIKYNTSLNSNSIEYQGENNIGYSIIYSFRLLKEKAALYHKFFGGDIQTYSERAIHEILLEQEIEKIIALGESSRFEIFQGGLSKYFMELKAIQIHEIKK